MLNRSIENLFENFSFDMFVFLLLFVIIYPIVFVALYIKKNIALFAINSINNVRLQEPITNAIVLVVLIIKKNQMLFTFDLLLCAFNS